LVEYYITKIIDSCSPTTHTADSTPISFCNKAEM